MLEEWLSPYLGESTPPPVAMTPKPVAPKPVTPQAPPPQAMPKPSDQASAPLAPAPSPAAPDTPAAPVTPSLDPMFSEGQKVAITADDMAAGGSIPLFADSSSSKPGPIVRPGTSLTILDGDLQQGVWMYLVRTDEGLRGWVSEKRLRLKF